MNKLEQLLKDTEFTNEEWHIFRKVEKNNHLEDLKATLDCMLANQEITEEQYNDACNNAELIVEKYDDVAMDDWQNSMTLAIESVIR